MSAILNYITANYPGGLNVENLKDTYITTTLSASGGSLASTIGSDTFYSDTVKVYAGASFITPPALVLVSKGRSISAQKAGEIILLTSVDGGDDDLFNIIRVGADRKDFNPGANIMANFFAEHLELANSTFEQAENLNTLMSKFLRLSFGATDNKIIRTTFSPTTDGEVTRDSLTQIDIAAFSAFIDSTPVDFTAKSITYTANGSGLEDSPDIVELPIAGQFRIDLIEVDSDGVVQIVKGTPDSTTYSAPSRTSGRVLLAEVELSSTGVASDSEITDMREYF